MAEIILAILLACSVVGNVIQCFTRMEVKVTQETSVTTTVYTESKATADSYNINIINNRVAQIGAFTNGSNTVIVIPKMEQKIGLTNKYGGSVTNEITNFTSNYTRIGWR